MAFDPCESFPRHNLYRAWIVSALIIFVIGLIKWLTGAPNGPG